MTILVNGHLTVPRWILRGCATKGDGTRRSEATAEISHEADYFYGDYHGGSIDRILFVPSLRQADEVKTSSSKVLANGTESVDKWIKELSDEELEELVSFSENDIF